MTNRIFLTILTFFGMLGTLKAQDADLILATGKDASQYLKNYGAPAINGLMYDLSDGWYSTAKTHKFLGFDLSISVSAARVPESDKTFEFNSAEYSKLKLEGGGSAILPTVAGGETSEKLTYNWGGDESSFGALHGAGDRWPDQLPIKLSIPSAMVQVGVGLPLKTDLKLRFFPKTSSEDFSYSLLGVGLQHNLSQYLDFIKSPAITVSGLAAFTSAKVSYFSTDFASDVNSEMALSVNSYVLQLLGEIDLKIINLFVGVGHVGGTTNFDVLGNYELDYNLNGNIEADEKVKDPVSIDFSVSGIKTTAGVRLNLGPIKFFGTYSFQEYSSFSTGIVFSIR